MACLKVTKFGGRSLADAEQFRKVKKIIEADPSRKYIVPSAPGKRYPSDEKVTDMLISCFSLAHKELNIRAQFDKIRNRYFDIATELDIDTACIEDELDIIEQNIQNKSSRDYAASRGEYINAILLSEYLSLPFLDAKNIIHFNDDGRLNQSKTHEQIKCHLADLDKCVIPGFYGIDSKGNYHVFSRGGSDITAALIARSINADIYENWTDISGFRAADPRIVPDSKYIQQLTYKELRELSYMGATVLHEDSVFPVRDSGIPTRILNTNDPLHPGTLIHYLPQHKAHLPLVTGIAGKKGFTAITIEKLRMNSELGFGRKVLQVLEKHKLTFDHLPTGIDTMSIIVSTDSLLKCKYELKAEIESAVNPDSINFTDKLAMVAVVGNGMSKKIGIAARLFTALAEQGIIIKTIIFAPSELCVIIGIDEDYLETSIRSIYDTFIRD